MEASIMETRQKFINSFEKELMKLVNTAIEASSKMTSERIDQAQRVLMHEFNQFDKELQARISTLRGHLDNVKVKSDITQKPNLNKIRLTAENKPKISLKKRFYMVLRAGFEPAISGSIGLLKA
jgi:hypothetical protein